jgi:hypothetical protein
MLLKAVKFVKLTGNGEVRNKVVGVFFFGCLEGGVDGERVGASEGVVSFADLGREGVVRGNGDKGGCYGVMNGRWVRIEGIGGNGGKKKGGPVGTAKDDREAKERSKRISQSTHDL